MEDDMYYKRALTEYDSGNTDESLLAKAYILAEGDLTKQKFEYVTLRVGQYKRARNRKILTQLGLIIRYLAADLGKLVLIFIVGSLFIYGLAQL
jgi:hypothetical protein